MDSQCFDVEEDTDLGVPYTALSPCSTWYPK